MAGAIVLERAARVVADSLGSASAILPPVPVGERWALIRMTAQSDTPNASGTMRVYRGVGGSYIDGTTSADSDVSDGIAGVELFPGEQVSLVWSTCTVGAVFTALASFEVRR